MWPACRPTTSPEAPSFPDAIARFDLGARSSSEQRPPVLAGFAAYTGSVWTMTTRPRAAAPGGRHGASVYAADPPGSGGGGRSRSRATTADGAARLPPGSAGYSPGSRSPPSVLLLAGPSADLGGDPDRLQPLRRGAASRRRVEVRARLAPATALLLGSPPLSPHARRRRRLGAPPPRGHRGRNGYRTRSASPWARSRWCPRTRSVPPSSNGDGHCTPHCAYQTGFTEDVTGQFLATRGGPVRACCLARSAGSISLRFTPCHRAGCRSPPYPRHDHQPFRRLRALRRRPRPSSAAHGAQALAEGARARPAQQLRPGRYLFHRNAPGDVRRTGFRVSRGGPARAAVTAIGSGSRRRRPDRGRALPGGRDLVAFSSGVLLRFVRQQPAGQKALGPPDSHSSRPAPTKRWRTERWSTGSSAPTTWPAVCSPSPAWAPGRVAPAPSPGARPPAGRARRRHRRRGTLGAPRPGGRRRAGRDADRRPPANDALGGHTFLWAVVLNSLGTIFLVGGSLYAIIQQQPSTERLDRRGRAHRRPRHRAPRTGHYGSSPRTADRDRADVLRFTSWDRRRDRGRRAA